MKMGTTASYTSPKVLLQHGINKRAVKHRCFKNAKNIIQRIKQTSSSAADIVISDHKEVMECKNSFSLPCISPLKISCGLKA